jgi:hypothetical protein
MSAPKPQQPQVFDLMAAINESLRLRQPAGEHQEEPAAESPEAVQRAAETWSWKAILDIVAERAGWTAKRFREAFGDDDCALHRFLESEGDEPIGPPGSSPQRDFVQVKERAALVGRLAEVTGFDRIAADRLADEVAVLVVNRRLDSRSAAADALLDYRNPPRSERSDRLAALEETNRELADALEGIRAEAGKGLRGEVPEDDALQWIDDACHGALRKVGRLQ